MTERRATTNVASTATCPKCGRHGEFGYKVEGAMVWFCAEHRLAKHYAEARRPPEPAPAPDPLAEHAEAIRAAGTRVIDDIIKIGHHLTEAKVLCGYGNWLSWLKREFGWSDDTARRFMQVFELSNSARLRNLNLPLSGLYLLARPSTPEAARQEVFDKAESGEPVSYRRTQDIVAKHKKPYLPSYTPDAPPRDDPSADGDLIDQIINLFEQLTRSGRVRCAVQ